MKSPKGNIETVICLSAEVSSEYSYGSQTCHSIDICSPLINVANTYDLIPLLYLYAIRYHLTNSNYMI